MTPRPHNRSPDPNGPPQPFRVLSVLDDSLRRVVEHPSVPRQFWHIVQMVVINARRVQIPRMAAALSYRTIFGLIPMLVVGLVFLAAFSSQETVTKQVRNLLDLAGLNIIEVKQPDESAFFDEPDPAPAEAGPLDPSAGPTAAGVDSSASSAGNQPSPGASASEKKLDAWIESLVQRVRKLPPGTLGVVGILTLIYAAISMLVEVEKTFNQIYMAPSGRSWSRRIIQYWALLTLGSIGLVLTFGAREAILTWAEHVAKVQPFSVLQTAITQTAALVVPIAISAVLLVVVYTAVPNTRVRFGAALVGALLAAVLWEASKAGLRMFVQYSVGYSKLYGPLALLPLFLLWVYVTWIIILSGLQIAHALQSYSTAKAAGLTRSVLETLGLVAQQAQTRRSLIVDPAAILSVMTAAAERFVAGKPTDHSSVADKTGIDERVVSEMLERLGAAGLLHRVSGGEHEGSYTLTRPPELILARDVLAVGEEMTAVDRERAPRLMGELVARRLEILADRSLADVIGMPRAPASPSVTVSTRAPGAPAVS